MMCFMVWMAVWIFIPVFAPSLEVLAFGEAMCGISWGVFQVRQTKLWEVSQLISSYRHFPQPTHLKPSQLYLDHMLQPTSACAGVLEFFSRLVSYEQLQVFKEI